MFRSLLLFLAVALAATACSGTAYVPRIEIANPTPYNLLVDVRGKPDGAAVKLGIVNKGEDSVREQVIDVGERWIFTYSYLGEEVGSTTVKRSDLQGSDWKITIPPDVGARLEQKGVAHSY